jgi:hypothetical protein
MACCDSRTADPFEGKRKLLKCERQCPEIKGPRMRLLQKVYSQIPVEEFAGFDRGR